MLFMVMENLLKIKILKNKYQKKIKVKLGRFQTLRFKNKINKKI